MHSRQSRRYLPLAYFAKVNKDVLVKKEVEEEEEEEAGRDAWMMGDA